MFEAQKRGYQLSVLLIVAVGYFLIQIGMTQITAIIPTIAASLEVGTNLGSWVLTGYLLFLSAWVLIAGRAGDIFGNIKVFAIGMSIFAVATLGAGLAGDIWQLIGFRCLQGFGGAFVLANGFAILRATFAEHAQGRAIGAVLTTTAFGGAFGVLGGTQVVASIGWRPLFLVLVPLALLVFIGAVVVHRSRSEPQVRKTTKLDFRGALFLFLALATLSLSVSHLHDGPETFEAGWPYHSTMHVISLCFFIAFIWQERRAPQPIIEFRHFRNGKFTTALAINFLLHMTMLGSTFTMPFVVERALRLTPADSGYVQTAIQLAVLATSFVSGWYYDRTRSLAMRPLALVGLATGLVFLAGFGPGLGLAGLVVLAAILGLMLGVVNTVNNTVVMALMPVQQRGFAAGMLETTRQLGHTMAVAVASALIVIGNPNGLVSSEPISWLGFQAVWVVMAMLSLAGVGLSLTRRRRRAAVAVPID